MVALAVTPHNQQLVADVAVLLAVRVQVRHPTGEALPLRPLALGVVLGIRAVRSVDEAEVVRSLVWLAAI